MRLESSVLSVSWIPSQAISGLPRLPFDLGITHYDDPPPDEVIDPEPGSRSTATISLTLATLAEVSSASPTCGSLADTSPSPPSLYRICSVHRNTETAP